MHHEELRKPGGLLGWSVDSVTVRRDQTVHALVRSLPKNSQGVGQRLQLWHVPTRTHAGWSNRKRLTAASCSRTSPTQNRTCSLACSSSISKLLCHSGPVIALCIFEGCRTSHRGGAYDKIWRARPRTGTCTSLFFSIAEIPFCFQVKTLAGIKPIFPAQLNIFPLSTPRIRSDKMRRS